MIRLPIINRFTCNPSQLPKFIEMIKQNRWFLLLIMSVKTELKAGEILTN